MKRTTGNVVFCFACCPRSRGSRGRGPSWVHGGSLLDVPVFFAGFRLVAVEAYDVSNDKINKVPLLVLRGGVAAAFHLYIPHT